LNEANNQNAVVLANLPAGRTERRIAHVIALALLGIGVIVLPFGRVQLPRIVAWIPITSTFIFIADLITWFLLISQFKIVRSRALLVLASGYLFTAVMNIPHLLTFPGAFSVTGLLGAGLQTSVWLAIFWMSAYPLVVVFYSVVKEEPRALTMSWRTAVAASIAVVIAVAFVLTWIAVAGDPYLPKLYVDRTEATVALRYIARLMLLPNALAVLLIWFRERSVLDVWLTVAMCGWMGHDIAQTSLPGRYTLGLYAGRSLFAISSTVVLVVLLKETTTLYGRLADSLVALRRLSAEKLRRSEAYLSEAQRLSHTGSFGWSISSGEIHWSEETYKILEYDPAVKPALELVFQRIHPDDRDFVQRTIDRAAEARADLDFEHRLLMPDGSVKQLHVLARASETFSGDLEFVGAVTDVTQRKRAEETLRQSEAYLAEAQRLSHTGSWAWDPFTAITTYMSEECYRILGLDPQDGMLSLETSLQRIHPDDLRTFSEASERATRERVEFELDYRFRHPGGEFRDIHVVGHPVFSPSGDLVEFVGTLMDVTERKRAAEALRKAFEEIKDLRDQLYRENLALKEEIDRASMFEEIVGVSPALRAVLSRVSKVAPTDSTVLITGETGTGKELIARAVHKRSQRSSRAFVSINCAATPRDLIASELFGHEKGAFTGATQRRLGRFELAEGGTIFLDEIGELPAETQIALLRVLQEHEFERVGGTGTIRTNVRVIAATNRDLQAAIASGRFRSDLFYRLNVFPIEVPPLRERREDIPVLVEYFIDRFARKAGKSIRGINKKSLELLQSYPWPGNIRELQNVIERSVIVCDTENFSVDESWLSRQPPATEPSGGHRLFKKLPSEEKAIIEAALRESGGQVYGPSGAASRLGIPRSTLESKIRSLKIDKNRFRYDDPSQSS
jgi:formate hydrogenlyase transcriptional activator